MKAPLTSNSITDRVQFTGLYIPDATWHAGAEVAEPDHPETTDAATGEEARTA